MKVRVIAVLAAVCLLTAGAWASPIISVGTVEAQPGTTKTFSISVTGGGAVQGLDLYIQIGDGGAANNGSGTKPIITNVDIVGPGTMFNASNGGQTNTWAFGLLWAVSTTTDTNKSNYLDASGVIAYVTIDTAGTAIGESYPLRLSGVATGIFGSPGVDTAFAGVPAAITNGRIDIVSEPAPVAGDANLDGVVDAADYITVKQNFGMTGAQWLDGDFCGDHQVNWTDLQILMTNFGTRSGTTPATTPEPATLGLLALGGLALLRRKSSDSQSRRVGPATFVRAL